MKLKNDNKMEGICDICGKKEQLSFEHIPPPTGVYLKPLLNDLKQIVVLFYQKTEGCDI